MDNSRHYVISVQLHNFFVDHRANCRIFVKKNMKCIHDLEQHLTELFGVKDFYLLCEKQLLPSNEDIRIIQPGDQIV